MIALVATTWSLSLNQWRRSQLEEGVAICSSHETPAHDEEMWVGEDACHAYVVVLGESAPLEQVFLDDPVAVFVAIRGAPTVVLRVQVVEVAVRTLQERRFEKRVRGGASSVSKDFLSNLYPRAKPIRPAAEPTGARNGLVVGVVHAETTGHKHRSTELRGVILATGVETTKAQQHKISAGTNGKASRNTKENTNAVRLAGNLRASRGLL